MKKFFLFTLALVFTSEILAQDSNKAEILLDKVYHKAKEYENIFIDFKYVLNNTDANTTSEARGDVTLENNKYLFNIFGTQQLFDGAKVYTIVAENEEVTIENKSNSENGLSPSEMLTFYKEGYTYKWDILQNIQGRKIQYIKLTPIDTNTEIKTILLGIDVGTNHIYKMIQTGKNNTTTTITVNSFKTNQPISKTLFTFNETKYKNDGYYIIRNEQ